jgi:hypothetical protein
MPVVPASHAGLLDRPLPAVLTTEMPDGRFRSTVVGSTATATRSCEEKRADSNSPRKR